MECSQCGAKNPPDASFCGSCGHSFAALRPVMETSFTERSSVVADPVSSLAPKVGVDSTLKILVIIGTLFMPLLGIILGLIYMSNASPEKKAVGRTWLIVGVVTTAVYMACVLSGAGSGGV